MAENTITEIVVNSKLQLTDLASKLYAERYKKSTTADPTDTTFTDWGKKAIARAKILLDLIAKEK